LREAAIEISDIANNALIKINKAIPIKSPIYNSKIIAFTSKSSWIIDAFIDRAIDI
jgi:hypothetical protein